ncbi:MAG: phosphoribosylformylglycinamidine synthase subunit PurL [Planctomycetes bacterium]|nr:phosphoribosylformylglycinamidine synthase subunit PurL [Planctomycetota bacterium]
MSLLFTITITREGDPRGRGDLAASAALRTLFAGEENGIAAVRDDVYFLLVPGSTRRSRIEAFAREFLAGDPTRRALVAEAVSFPERAPREASIIVLRKPGVMDPVEGSVLHALADAGFARSKCRVRTAKRFRFRGSNPSRDELIAVATASLANPIVDDFACFLPGERESLADPFREFEQVRPRRAEIPLCDADDASLLRISEHGGLSLDLSEMRAIRAYYRDLGREPNDIELETIAQTWSEHCCHKTMTGPIDYGGETIQNLLEETIFAATNEIAAPFCISVFRDNAGVIAIDDEWALTFKVETHNHPSALEPYGGAGTGVGGVIRDTLGTGLGALPVLSTDVFCFGMLDAEVDHLPAGAMHPRRLLSGVVAGVRDYGNRMGIPTANGAIFFHPGYVGNPLVFCGSIGLIPRRAVAKEVRAGDLIVAVGGRTGRDGIHGATFSSRELNENSETISAGAVQIGNPIEEKKVLDALLRARDEGLYRSITDCGAGGFSSAIGEMGRKAGAKVELSAAPLKYPGLTPSEIWISEAQERMVLAVPPEKRARLFEILAEEEVEGSVLGRFGAAGAKLRLEHGGKLAGELAMAFLHDGRPRTRRRAKKPAAVREAAYELLGAKPAEILRTLLSHPNVASKEFVVRQYDHEVQGRMVLLPFTGPRGDAPADGCAFDPLRTGTHTVVVGCGLLPLLGDIDPFEMGAQAVDEAARNVIASGGTLERLALLDNFAWGNVNEPEILGALVECARGAAAAARAYRTPFISGKDSLHNTYRAGGFARSIPHTLLVSAVSIARGAPRAPAPEAKRAGSALLLVGPVRGGVPGSLLQCVYAGMGGNPAPFDGALGREILAVVEEWIARGIAAACHDVSDGGLAVAAAEMGIGAAGEGIALDLDALMPAAKLAVEDLLFGEGPHRFLVEMSAEAVTEACANARVPIARVGEVTSGGRFTVSQRGKRIIDEDLAELRAIWQAPLAAAWSAAP